MRKPSRFRKLWPLATLCALVLGGCRRPEPPPPVPREPSVARAVSPAPAGSQAPAMSRAPAVSSAASTSGVKEAGTDARVPVEPPPFEVRLAPDRKPGERLPLVVFLHPLGGSARAAFEALPLERLGALLRVHVVAPDGTLDSNGRRFWNANASCCDFDGRGPDDVARLRALIDLQRARPEVDPERVYVVGVSNGAFMAFELACRDSAGIAAIAALSGAVRKREDCRQPRGLGVLLVHGDADPIVGYAAGRVFGDPRLAPHLSAPEGLREWARRLACAGEPQIGPALDLDASVPGEESAAESYAECPHGDATLLTVRGGSHWIGNQEGVQQAVWKFLLSHRLQ